MPRIAEPAALAPGSEAVFGGKAAGLGRLMAAGARVPGWRAVEATTVPVGEWPEADRQGLVAAAADLLASGPIAVRSSALGEDSAERSFAGLFETVLGVGTVDEALAAAQRCIASGASARVAAYLSGGPGGGAGALAVGLVLQRMVPARAAGVCFTVDPLGEDGAVLVEAVAGTGDALVSGREQAERWRVYRDGRGEWVARRAGPGQHPVLSEAEAREIAAEAAALHAREGRPLDLEWAIDAAGARWWLQSRPITSWRPPRRWAVERAAPEADDGPVTVWSNWNVRETMPDPMHPLTWALWRDVLAPAALRELVGVDTGRPPFRELAGLDLVQGRVYFNMNALLGLPLLGRLAAPIMRVVDARAGETVRRLRDEGVLSPRRPRVSRARLAFSLLRSAPGRLAVLPTLLAPRRALSMLAREGRALLDRSPVGEMSEAALVEEIALYSAPCCRKLMRGLPLEGVAMGVYGLAARAFRSDPEAAALLAAGIEGPTTATTLAIERLGEQAAPLAALFLGSRDAAEALARLRESEAGRAWLAALEAFLAEFGQRGPKEFDLGMPRWYEAPTMVVDLVTTQMRTGGEPVRTRVARLRARRETALGEAIARRPVWQRPWLRLLARLVELYLPLREAPKHYGMFVFRRMREAALELGRRLAARGVLATAGDVFFLTWEELRSVAAGAAADDGLRSRVETRQEEYRRFLVDPAPDFVRSDGVPVEETLAVAHEPGLLRGVAISAGRATGPVRKLTEPDPRKVQPGDVVVMEFADPGWTPLFPRAAAVVMEVGGVMCHAAVVAREIGVPAVFGVREAMARLEDGAVVEVDGTRGTVRLGAAAP